MNAMKRILVALVVAVVLGPLAPAPASATSILAEVINLVDTSPGEDLWRYSYGTSGLPGPLGSTGFTVYFDRRTTGELRIPPGAESDGIWDVFVAQHDLVLPSDGFYDALQLGLSILPRPLLVDFVWLGGRARPGSQPFDIYSIETGELRVLESGRTTLSPPVSEPVTIWLLATAVLARRRLVRAQIRRG